MIEYVRLSHFQKHAELHVAFAPGVNVIVGDTGAGKSSVIRAILWACLGGASTSYPAHGGGRCDVRLGVDGKNLLRRRGKSTNLYRLGGKQFDAVGVSVPQEVADALMMTALNFQKQLDPPFLITAPAPEVSRLLNRVVNLDLIDRTLGHLDAQVRRCRDDARASQASLEAAETRRASFGWVDDARAALERLEALQRDADALSSRLETVRTWRERLERAYRQSRQSLEVANRAAHLRNLLDRVHTLQGRVRELTHYRERIQNAERSVRCPPAPVAAGLRDAVAAYKAAVRKAVDVTVLVGKVKEAEERRCRTAEAATAAGAALAKLRRGRCPLCGK